ncbi:uracil-DNA glycosylase family protein [Fulvimarina sp. 2208YS6-2-32]|uniref:Uracil-DNA glycosylase family protein n=1 Tax=Fulvimarina uroteuthidis TaxID=3098149 RepID=A0ABU5I3T1_9HYPH|nr:uracil-DNA glycosylase family protein [Fulvimarina sp. 2208YS6-2-32]MDY8110023.1 uracil-DNA glycosylase family protein [Fulvimarina sp. 2208YS6-2-32]
MAGDARPESAAALQAVIRTCRICAERPIGAPLPVPPNPVLAMSQTARVLIAGQAPGNLADKTSTPFNDPSGVRLRTWLGVDEAVFYDRSRIAILPMGFCFPGYDRNGSDRPPRKECRATWHDRAMDAMPQIELILAIGAYAQAYHIAEGRGRTLTETVENWRTILEHGGRYAPVIPLPHPSWRNNGWLRKHAWFGAELLPVLRERVARAIALGA